MRRSIGSDSTILFPRAVHGQVRSALRDIGALAWHSREAVAGRARVRFMPTPLHARNVVIVTASPMLSFAPTRNRCGAPPASVHATTAARALRRFGTVSPWWRELHWPACAGPREHWISEAFESELGRYLPVASNAVRTPDPDAIHFVYAASALGDPSLEVQMAAPAWAQLQEPSARMAAGEKAGPSG